MSVAFIYGPNSPRADLTGTVAFYEQNAAVRSSFDQAAEWTGISVSQLLRKRELPTGDSVMRLHSISLTAAMLGIQDALCDLGVRPDLVGGVSLGGVVSSAAAGALTRRQLFEFLLAADHAPAARSLDRQEALAFVFMPADEDPGQYYGPEHPGVFLAMDCAISSAGDSRTLILTGYREALERLAVLHPLGNVWVRDQQMCCAAYHSPLRRGVGRVPVEKSVAVMHIDNPEVPVCSGVMDKVARSAGDIRELILHNDVDPAMVSVLAGQVAAQGIGLVLAIGPSMTRGLFSFPCPVVHVDAPEDLAGAVLASARAHLSVLAALN
jgi:[acyl-carrier-protein] S-malonyltransferase